MTMIQVDVAPALRMVEKVQRVLLPTSLEMFLDTQMRTYLVQRIEERFADQGDDVSGPWAPLAPATMMIRMQQGYSPTPTNIRSGEMFNALKNQRELRPTATGAELSLPGSASRSKSLTDKLRVAQKGGTAPGAGRDTPPRPVLGLSATDMAAFTTRFETWLLNAVR